MAVIRFESVSKSFGEHTVLRDFTMEVQAGETKILMGGIGSGKSTILRMVLGLIKPDTGRVFVDEQEISHLSEDELMPIRRKIGMVFQEGALFDALTVGENVAYRLHEANGYEAQQIQRITRELLGFVGLEEAIDQFPSELSGGMVRRVGIARALAGEPTILLYDAPTEGLDPITARTISELIIRLRDLQNTPSIVATHDLKLARTIASEFAELGPDGQVVFKTEDSNLCLVNTRFVILREGCAFFDGTDEELERVEDAYLREFLE